MADREESGFRVTDRRKYNPDGSPRDFGEGGGTADQPEAEGTSANNVVTSPGEAIAKEEITESATLSTDTAKASGVAESTQAAAAAARHAESAYNNLSGPQQSRLPDATFLSLANMLAVEAAMHLGLIQGSGEEPPDPDLDAARHLIDLLGILQSKTAGNLTNEEDSLLENMLADLRMQFVAISKRR
jgi:hypothetical protein